MTNRSRSSTSVHPVGGHPRRGGGQVAAGYVLTCQASPVTDALTVDYDG
ncbi:MULTISPECIES: hypothetical protein [unclassified Micromonospora]|nr:hypothetical protein [Micromonospora sp. RL09-050-HVF-A]MBW4704330.1 hypothetical protein [Micromonospora sp. RL09-050-HVF-A]